MSRASRFKEAASELHPGVVFMDETFDEHLQGVSRPRHDLPAMALYSHDVAEEAMRLSADVLIVSALEGEDDSKAYWREVVDGMVHIANTNEAVRGTVELAPCRPDLELPVGLISVDVMYSLGAKLFSSSPIYVKDGKKYKLQEDGEPVSTSVDRNLLDKNWGPRGPVFVDMFCRKA